MTRTTPFLFAILLNAAPLDAAKVTAPTPAGGAPARPLTVRLYNYLNADANAVRAAAGIAREIYLRAGVETRWLLCEMPDRENEFDDPCTDFAGPETIRMQIVRAPADSEQIDRLVFGFALPVKKGFGTVASVFWDRIVGATQRSEVSAAKLLGVVMAHEAGHLLLGFNSHSARGLMNGRWDDERFRQISQGGLGFLGSQKKRIEAGALGRLAAGMAAVRY